MKWNDKKIFLALSVFSTCIQVSALPSGFVYLENVAPNIVQDMRYAGTNNFIGRVIDGYESPQCIVRRDTALALAKVQFELESIQKSLIVYDCYRPTRAVADFVQWSQNDDQKMKPWFYPREHKKNLFNRGYIAKYSSHSTGFTIDLSIYDSKISSKGVATCYINNRIKENGIDMGTNYDCLDPMSNLGNKQISTIAQQNREGLAKLMKKYGFKLYSKEWWHFTFKQSSFKRTYFNFPVK